MRIVVKVGTGVLTAESGKVQDKVLRQLITDIGELFKNGHEIILVSSGAVAAGRHLLPNINVADPRSAWAAVGQPAMMQHFEQEARKINLILGQCLILRVDFTDRDRYNHLVQAFASMLKAKILPVMNGNDVVARNDLTVGDNDVLAAMVAIAVDADKLILLTDQAGLFTAHPKLDPTATLVSEVKNVDRELERLCDLSLKTPGKGGMISKVRAAKRATHAGVETYIADGRTAGTILEIIKGNNIGTKFLVASKKPANEHKRWLMVAKGYGQVVVDEGAIKALRNKKSLLFPGVIGVKGLFDKGEIVEVMDKGGLAVAYGKTNYSQADLQQAMEHRKTQAVIFEKEIIHRDHLVVLG